MKNFAAGIALTCIAAGIACAQPTPKGGTQEGAKLKNPVASTPQSAAAGKAVFQAKCLPCHGPKGDGEGATMPAMDVKPADLTRADYTYGTTDGDVFTNVKNGIRPNFSMPSWDGQIADGDIWNLVNYLKTLRAK